MWPAQQAPGDYDEPPPPHQQQQPGGSFSPLTAGLHSQRSSRDSLALADEQQQTWLQQLDAPHAAAYVSVLGGSSSSRDGAGPQHSPRSPSRLRYVRKESAGGGGGAAPAQQQLPDFLQVQELPAGILREDEVEIVHQEGNEAVRAADVEDKIIRQVDDLVAYFNGLFQDGQVDISLLQQEVMSRDMELSKKNMLIQQLLAAQQQQQQRQQQPVQQPYTDPGLWAAVKRSWQRSRCCWLSVLLLLVALVLVIALPAGLVRRPGPAAPAFAWQPQLLGATAGSLDASVAVSRPAVVHYVLLAALDGGGSGWSRWSAADVQAAAAGWSSNSRVSACGSLRLDLAPTNTTLSVSSVASPECTQQQAQLAAGGGRHSCSRCPVLDAGTQYDVLLVAEADGALSDQPARLVAATLPGSSSRAPRLRNGAAAAARAPVGGAEEGSFDLSFQMNAPGSVRFFVVYAQVYARFVDTYIVFDNTVSDPTSLLASTRDSFQDGLVARGTITVGQEGGGNFTCTIGGGAAAGGSCRCTPAAECAQEAACFGSLCDYSKLAFAPSTAYKVILLPASLDGQELGPAAQLPVFSTADEASPPQLSPRLGINPLVGPDRFSVFNISQDKPGFAYLLVTRPANQVNTEVAPGTASGFKQVPGARRSRGGRQLTAAAATTTTIASASLAVLPQQLTSFTSGAAFLPPCRTALPCEQYLGSAQDYTSPGAEVLVFSQCVPVAKITQQASALVTTLANNTLYRVAIVPTDRNNNQDAWSAFVRTQDLAPPVLTVVDTPPPDFDKFSVLAQLDEPGTLFATLLLSASAPQVTAAIGCPPTFTGAPLVGQATIKVDRGSTPFTVAFDTGLTANTDYVLRLIAVDAPGNCQAAFTDLPVHTLDNIPPNTLALDVVDVGGTRASLQLTLDEPASASFAVLPRGTPCPAAAMLFAAAAVLPQGAVAAGNFSVPVGHSPAPHNVSDLASETDYTACVIAADVTRLRNQQAAAAAHDFRTLDVTPPALSVAVAAGSDGSFTCDRTSFLCSLTFSAGLSEPGSISWLLTADAALPAPLQLPSPQQLMAADGVSRLFANATVLPPSSSIAVNSSATSTNTTLPGLVSETSYTLLLAARDAAVPAPNYLPQLRQLQLVAPDVTPPVFTAVGVQAAADTSLTLGVTLNEASTVYHVVVSHPSATPTPTQVAAGLAANGSQPASAGSGAAVRNTSAALMAAGLTPGSWFDVYLVARDDPGGNLQPTVTNITRVRTTDSVAPQVTALTATFTPPMSLRLSFSISKAGSLWLAPRRASLPPPTAQEVLDAVAARSTSGAAANFTTTVPVLAASTPTSHTLCVADGDQLVVYAVARDTEGQWPGRQDNVSPLQSTPVVLEALSGDEQCPSLAYLQPSLAFAPAATPDGLPGMSPLGLMLGARTSNASGSINQGVVAFSNAAVLGQHRQLAASVGATSAPSGAIRLPGSAQVTLQPLPPASIAVILCSTQLTPDANADNGSTLRVSYQLRDSAGRSQVDASALVVRPVLSYEAGAAPPAGVAAAANVLADCSLISLGAASGVGQCSVVLDRKLFPAAGSLAARVTLRVLVGGVQVDAAEAAGLQLAAPPVLPAFAPSSQPGLLVTLPYRALHLGETVRVTLQAVNPLMQGITGFTVPLRYDATVLELREARSAALWQPVAVGTAPDGGNFEVAVLSAGRAAGQAEAAYRADTNGIGLAELLFTVKASRAGTAVGVISVVTAPTANVQAALSLWPTWPAPFAQINSFSGASAVSGSLNIEAVTSLGMWAWADAHELLNTAVLTGQQVSTALRGTLVRNWGTGGSGSSNSGDALAGCSIAPAASGPRPASVAIDALRQLCNVNVNAANTVPAKGMAVTLTIQAEALAAQSAQISLDVWTPSALALSAADTTLNSVLPLNAAPASASCSSFQSTQLQLTAAWSNGGPEPSDALAAADVTALVSFSSNDTTVAQVAGGMVKGLSPGTALVTTPAAPDQRLVITVSSEPACLVQLHTVATTGVALTAAGNGSSSSDGGEAVLRPGGRAVLSWRPQQQLAWEDSSALVLSYARFSDGAVMDVTDKAAVVAVAPAAPELLPFSLTSDNTTGLSWVTVNAKVGAATPCQQFLASSWAACSSSVPLGTGSGSVHVTLPHPTGIADFTASPGSLTSPGDRARLSPMLVATSSSLSLSVAFDDGSVRDFSADARVAYAMAPGSTLCQVEPAPGGGFRVVASAPASSSVSGSCAVTATISFGGTALPLAATTSMSLVGLSRLAVVALGAGVAAVPALPPVPPGGVVLGDELVLLKCDAANYNQRTLWTFGVLSNCTSNSSCPLVDLNSRQYTALNSSEPSVAALTAGAALTSYPLLDNTLVPLAAGTSAISATFAAAASRAFTLTVRDTYAPTWPAASVLSDTSAHVAANMSEGGLSVTYMLVSSAQLDLQADPPVMPSLAQVQAGVTLLPDASQGPNFLSATAAGLMPGTNYTVLAAVGVAGASGSSPAASPTVTALSGLLVPDTAPPSFTRAAVVAVMPNSGDGTFSLSVELGLDEGGRVLYGVYGDPACISADPSPAEIASGVNLADVGKCSCVSRFCAPAAFGSVPVGGANASVAVTLRAALPPFPFDNLGADASCSNFTASSFASTKHAIYFVAEDQLPTFKGWTSVCSMPPPPQAPAQRSPCPAVHVARCTNTPPAAESVNRQAPPFADVSLAAAAGPLGAASIPAGAPVKGVASLVDPVAPGFVAPAVASTGTAVVWTFGITKPGLVQWRLVEQVTRVIASGLLAVVDASQTLTVPISRKCSGEQLVVGTSYALWHNMTDMYGAATDVSIVRVTL